MIHPLLLVVLLLAAPVVCPAQSDASSGRSMEGFELDTFSGADAARDLGLFEPLPDAVYPTTFRFDIPEFQSYRSPFAVYMDPAGANAEEFPGDLHRQILGLAPQGQFWKDRLSRAEKLLEAHPNELKNIRGLAVLCALAGQYERAARNFARYIEKKPDDLAFVGGFAQTLFCLARFDDADSAIRRVLSAHPDHLPSLYTQICLQVATNGVAAATEDRWRTANILEKERLAGWLNADRRPLKQVLGLQGYARLCGLVVGPGSQGHLLLIPDSLASARHAFALRQWRKALAYYRLAEDYGVTGSSLVQQIARCLYETGRQPEALWRMRQLVKDHPDDAMGWYNLGYILIQSETAPAAVTAFRQAARLQPAVPDYRFALACALAVTDGKDEAFQILGELRKTHPGEFPGWMEGDAYYLQAIRDDARYSALR